MVKPTMCSGCMKFPFDEPHVCDRSCIPPMPTRRPLSLPSALSIPILVNHDHTKVIGSAEWTPIGLFVRLKEPIERERLFDVFGNFGYTVESYVQSGDKMLVDVLKICEWSLPLAKWAPPVAT